MLLGGLQLLYKLTEPWRQINSRQVHNSDRKMLAALPSSSGFFKLQTDGFSWLDEVGKSDVC